MARLRMLLTFAAALLAVSAVWTNVSPGERDVVVGTGSIAAERKSVPVNGPIPCLDGSTVEFGEWCPVPQLPCADGSSVPLGSFCPLPAASDPDPVTCADGTTVPNGNTCAPVACPDGTSVPNGHTCAPVTCPNGATVPDGHTCPVSARIRSGTPQLGVRITA